MWEFIESLPLRIITPCLVQDEHCTIRLQNHIPLTMKTCGVGICVWSEINFLFQIWPLGAQQVAEVELTGYVFVSTAELLQMQVLLESHTLCVCSITVDTISLGDDAHNIFFLLGFFFESWNTVDQGSPPRHQVVPQDHTSSSQACSTKIAQVAELRMKFSFIQPF